ncbi:pinin/SDK/memA/ protein conserved region-domain-containing protein [Aspergillus pseudoustus]|uniref:Pinin/SDK/memA/ protein conserved region-domain-containing protein n=1 Tax=Aspergillus pseudoustus TaxID=1810923 RepID=A0ABR4KH56_9EURO
MTDGTLASAVIVPEQENLVDSPEVGLKRRQSSTTEVDSDTKRRRLSSQTETQDPETRAAQTQLSPKREEQNAERKRTRRDEERKRGQRLFGSLLGTLSQSSNSAAQRRRADIERKQQDKLKLQDEEYGELKKKRLEERLVVRRKEQRLYEKELMDTRHSNLLATAHFLKTKTEPVLFYKPWQLCSGDETIIRDQIREAEATIAREVEEYEARNSKGDEEPENETNLPMETPGQAPTSKEDIQETSTTQTADTDAAANDTNHEKVSKETMHGSPPATNNDGLASSTQEDDHRGAEDDVGEVMEDNEDTVIY